MPDILIIRRKSKSVVYGVSIIGCRWMRANIKGEVDRVTVTTIDNEFIDEFIEELKKDDLEVDEK
jgi:hypothetical protein